MKNYHWQYFFRFFATITISLLFLSSCRELESEKPNMPKQVISTTRSTVTGSGGEVGVSHTVRVRFVNKNGSGLYKLVPAITAVDGAGAAVAGISSGGCSITDGNGYANCSISSTVAGSYTLKVTSPVTYTGSTVTFTQVTRSMSILTQPTGAVSGVALGTQPVIRLLDRVGNLNVTGTDTVTVALTTPGSATISGVAAVAGVAGVVTFAGLSVDIAGSYTLTASGAGLTSILSDSFTITAGAASRLGFSQQPSTVTAANIGFASQPIVVVQDAQGNTVSSSCLVTVGLTATPAGDTFAGTFSRLALNGVADFTTANLRVLTTAGGTGYSLTATASGSAPCLALTSAVSDNFEITLSGVPYQLAVLTPPGTAPLNQVWTVQPKIQVLDIYGAVVTTDSTTVVTIAIDAGGTGTGSLGGAQSVTVTNGTATFTNLRIASTNSADAGTYNYIYTGVFPGATISSTTTTAQTINANGLTAPFAFEFEVQPANASLGATMATVTVKRVDANGHTNISDSTTTVGLTINGAGVLNNGGARALLNGVASFSNLRVTGTSGNHSLNAVLGAGGATTSATSDLFAISDYGTATRLGFIQQPVAGAVSSTDPWDTQPIVAIQDSAGNTVSSDNSTQVTLSVFSSSGTTTLTGSVTVTAQNGVATFTNVGTAQTGLTAIILRAESNPSYTSTQSNSFNGRP